MPKHVSKQEQLKSLLKEIESSIDRTNVDTAIQLLHWTKDKIQLAQDEVVRNTAKRKPRFVKRGTIYYANLGKNVGSEQNGYRPVLVIQQKKGNATSPTVIIIPLTDALDKNGNPKKVLDTQIPITHKDLKKPSLIKTEYIRSISKSRLRNEVCTLDSTVLKLVEDKLKCSVDIK